MINTSEEKSRAKSAKDSENRTARRAVQAQIVGGLQQALEPDEQLLGFTRGMIAGGLRGKLTVGFEALFAPYVNLGLTERRVVLQHVQPESGKPNEILPHSFPLGELHSIVFHDIETFGGEPAGRLNLRLFNEQHFRLRFRGAEQVADAKTIADVFLSLTSTRPKARTSPTQSVCPHCDQILDRVSRFCPYCGSQIEMTEPAPVADTAPETVPDDEAASAQPAEPFAAMPENEPSAAAEDSDTESSESVEVSEAATDALPPEGTATEDAAFGSQPEPATAEHETAGHKDLNAETDAEGDRTQ